MSSPIISVENLGKCYRIQHQQERQRYVALRDVITSKVKGLFGKRKAESGKQNSEEDFWALKDVSFEIKQGEVVGIIGRNGAGKSTLLKILSRITEPTTGRITLRGRVASLLEVGTGFHPELTGRENIFLNGAILGMSRVEIRAKFDEIVAFAEVEKFLDTPVKRYSSGMYVRLAFAVASHLEPEILIVDEVLAVGDVAFQKKCLGKMQEVSTGGRTVLFVSHNTAAIATLTKRALLLTSGKLAYDGLTNDGIKVYLSATTSDETFVQAISEAVPHQVLQVTLPTLLAGAVHISGSTLGIRVVIWSKNPIFRGCLSIQIVNESEVPILHLRAYDHGHFFGRSAGQDVLECEVENCCLNVGRYSLNLYLSGPPGTGLIEKLQSICCFQVEIHDKPALFDWRADACGYIVNENWVGRNGTQDAY